MSGAEPLLIGAAIGAGVGAGSSAIMGGDPIKGALLGGITGGVTGGLGGVGSAASAGAGAAGSAGQAAAASAIESGTAGLAGQALEQAALSPASAALIEGGTTGFTGDILEQAALGNIKVSDNTFMTGLQQLFENPYRTIGAISEQMGDIGLPAFDNMSQSMMIGNAMNMVGGGGQKNMSVSSPPMKQAQNPQFAQPVASLLDERRRAPQRRRLSLV